LGYEKRQSGYSPFVVFFSATFLQPWSLLRKALIRAAKTSVTLYRYVKWGLSLVENYEMKFLEIFDKMYERLVFYFILH